ncbi:COX15/CtaA family protein [Algicola sagamiensis]|uniref:COX15/CtaA family protein n=1 Tax=Algicola sagamiensis TaxID=163869 RepID=UPI0003749642|nr:COX15/CtaA family protein [Algicola sagamiensis]
MRKYVLLAWLMSLVVIGLGAYTRLTDAGLGCPDWPGCYGKLVVPSSELAQQVANEAFPERPLEPHKAWNEMLHRYVAGTLGLFIFGLFVHSWRSQEYRAQRPLTTFLCALVIFQAALGMWTVTMNLMPLVVMGHLLGGFTIMVLLCVLWYQLRERHIPPQTKSYSTVTFNRKLGWAAFSILVLQIALGGWTAANYAAVACTKLPICEGNWQERLDFPHAFSIPTGHENYEFGVKPYEARMTIHVTHRFGAIMTTLLLLAFSFAVYRQCHSLKKPALGIVTLLTCQITLGIGNIYWLIPLPIAVAHNLVAALLLASVTYTLYRLYRTASTPFQGVLR